MKNAFKAGSAYLELFASKKKLKSDLKKTEREIPPYLKRAGKKSGDQFEKTFGASERGKRMGQGLKRGVQSGTKGLKKALLGGTAIVGAGAVIGGTFAAIAKSALSTAREIDEFSRVAGISAERFQEMSFGASKFGVDAKELSEVLKDMNDRLGDSAQTGAGPLADFFENIAPKVGLTIDSFRELSSDQALGLFVKTLEDAGANQQDMTFYMEALASGSTKLLPLLKNNRREMGKLSKEARTLGIVLENGAVRQAAEADRKLETLGKTIKTGLTGAIIESSGEIIELTDKMMELVPTLVGWATAIINGLEKVSGLLETIHEIGTSGQIDFGPAFEYPILQDEIRQLEKARGKIAADLEKALDGKNNFINNFNVNRLEKKLRKVEKRLAKTKHKFDNIFADDDSPSAQSTASAAPSPETPTPSRIPAPIAFRSRKAEEDSLAKQNDALREARALFEQTRTPAEQYKTTLEAIATIGANDLLLAEAGGEETLMRARADAIVELANATGDAEAAMKALGEQSAKGNLDLETTTQTYIRINEELGVQEKRIQAAIDAREEAQRLSDEETNKLLDKVDAQALVVEQELILARLRGDRTEIENLEREIELLREKSFAIRKGATEAEANSVAETLVEDRDYAEMQGKTREAFKSGIRAAIEEGDLKSGVASLFDGIADNMFDRAIDTLSDSLFNLLSGLFKKDSSGGVGAGALGSVFAGFFANGGTIGNGQFGIVGEGGGMRHAELITGPATVTPLKALKNAVGPAPSSNDAKPIAINLVVGPTPYFDVRVTDLAVEAAAPIAASAAQASVQEAQKTSAKTQRRRLA